MASGVKPKNKIQGMLIDELRGRVASKIEFIKSEKKMQCENDLVFSDLGKAMMSRQMKQLGQVSVEDISPPKVHHESERMYRSPTLKPQA